MVQVVVDANYTGKGRYNAQQLERLVADIDSASPSLIIPEVVVWEWAEHLHADLAKLATRQASLRLDPSVFAPPHWAVPDVEALVERIGSSVST